MTKNSSKYLTIEEEEISELKQLCQPLFDSYAFNRLDLITFLGILSPRFRNQTESPLFTISNSNKQITDDGTRKSHSIRVALIMLGIARQLELSNETQKYAVSWGLLHDIATWPLSHTGEAAFSISTGINARKLREMMILGSSKLPQNLTVNRELKESGIKPSTLMRLFEEKNNIKEKEIFKLWQLIHSPITPDSLEGIWRTGKVFNIKVPDPQKFQDIIQENSSFETVIKMSAFLLLINFWEKKSQIYKKFINRPDIIKWESAWTFSIKTYFRHLDLVDSLTISEKELVQQIEKLGLIEPPSIYRYKRPQNYYVKDKMWKPENDIPSEELKNFLIKE